jgi:hypothetical protein
VEKCLLPAVLVHFQRMRAVTVFGPATATLVTSLALLVAACGQSPTNEPGPGPSPETGSGGKSGTGGSKASGGSATGGSSGTSTGGTPAASGGSSGSATGGSTGSGGDSGPVVPGTGGSTGTGGSPADASSPGSESDAAAPPASSEGAPYGCKTCTRLFNGVNLDGWITVPNAWVVKDGALASTGVAADIYTKEDLGDYRIFFQVRQLAGNHKPCTVLFGNRPADPTKPARGLGGAQFQPPNGASWNYGIGGTFSRLTNPNFDVKQWHWCEVLVKEAGSFRAACCPAGAGGAACKATEVLKWTGKGRKHPFDIMMHNAGLMDEYKEIWIERNPTVDDLMSTK